MDTSLPPLPELPGQPSRPNDDQTLQELAALTGLFSPQVLVEELQQLENLDKANDDPTTGRETPPAATPL